LSEELVKAELQVQEGRVAKETAAALELELVDMRKRQAMAIELLGEREERIEELTVDVAEMRDSYRQQIIFMADEANALRLRVSELERKSLQEQHQSKGEETLSA